MLSVTHEVSIEGRICHVPAIQLENDVTVVIKGRFVKIAEVFDEYWLEAHRIPDPQHILQEIQGARREADMFTFAQRVPEATPKYNYPIEWDNVAVIPVSTYDGWINGQISSASRRNVRTSERKGVMVKEVPFDEEYVRGIMSIYDETPIRGGRRFWHYGKALSAVQAENGTYRERSTFLGAYIKDELIGYMKIVWDQQSAAIMQVLSKLKYRDKRPNNALLAKAVALCADKKVPYLLYEKFAYGNKLDSSLTRFKQENGFVRMDLPRYYIPLSVKGRIFLGLGLHHGIKERLPTWFVESVVAARRGWFEWSGSRE